MVGALDADMAEQIAESMRGLGINLRTETKVEGFDVDDEGRVRAVKTDDGAIEADIVVLGIGSKPNVDLALAAGIAIGESGGIAVNTHMATGHDGIWACGDCVESIHRLTGKPVVIALGTHANKQGRIVGLNVTGGSERFRGVLGTAVTKLCAYEIGRTGLTEHEAQQAGIAHVTAKIESTTRAGYFPGAEPMTGRIRCWCLRSNLHPPHSEPTLREARSRHRANRSSSGCSSSCSSPPERCSRSTSRGRGRSRVRSDEPCC